MGWVKRKADEHQCPKPKWDAGVREGDIWECDQCKRQWIISKITFEDRPAGAIWIDWTLYRSAPAYAVNGVRTADDAARGVTAWRDR